MSSEFEFLAELKQRFNLSQLGDDCAVLPLDAELEQVVTCDLLIEEVDFRLDWAPPDSIGHKSLAASLSDIAAMGAEPLWTLLSVALPVKLWSGEFPNAFFQGFMRLATRFSTQLVGGDISRTDGNICVDCAAGGQVLRGRAIMRSGARPGDLLFVGGALGASAAGLDILSRSAGPFAEHEECARHVVKSQLYPEPQVLLAKQLNKGQIPTAMIDISDGLSSDLHRICEQSGVGAFVESERVPIDRNLIHLAEKGVFGASEAKAFALHGGEEYKLLASVPRGKREAAADLGLIEIGGVTETKGSVVLVTDDGEEELKPEGFAHF